MQQMGLSHRLRRRFKPMSLTDSHHDLPIAPNLLPHRGPTLKPDSVWAADITYVPTDEGWLYVDGVLNRCTRRCVGWAMDDTLATTLPVLDMALKQRRPPEGLVHHSDRGGAIRQCRLPAAPSTSGRHSQHEPQRQLL